ncbi:MAG: hypothetical protein PUA70_02085 [Oribacterium sp.]|nr:hypothetical protein [Oribacterium sp.]
MRITGFYAIRIQTWQAGGDRMPAFLLSNKHLYLIDFNDLEVEEIVQVGMVAQKITVFKAQVLSRQFENKGVHEYILSTLCMRYKIIG